MEFLFYLIPFIFAVILLISFKKEIVWWEYIVLIVPSILFILLLKLCMVKFNSKDIEYLGDYVERITYYEPWDELQLVTHSTVVPDGKGGTRIKTYTTLERVYHNEKYTMFTHNTQREIRITEKEYYTIRKRLGDKTIFRDMKRDYHSIDGDAYDIYWDKTVENFYDLTESKFYSNKIKSSQSNTIFKYIDISKEEAKKLGLYEYPDIYVKDNQIPILGKKVRDIDYQRIKYINGVYGKKYQIRVYILLYENKDIEISELQKSYWQNGNKNELIVCLGVENDSVIWTNSFSWCDKPSIEIQTRNYFIENPKLDINEYGKWLEKQIPNNWNRKNFEDFDYIHINLTNVQDIIIVILTIILNIILSCFLIENEYKN